MGSATNYQLRATSFALPLAAENRLFIAAFDVLKTHPLYVMLLSIQNVCSILAHTDPMLGGSEVNDLLPYLSHAMNNVLEELSDGEG